MKNPLTTIRDLVYQQRYSEAIRLTQSYPKPIKQIALPYIKTHTGNPNLTRKIQWLKISGYGLGPGVGYSRGYGSGYGSERGSVGGWGDGSGRGHGLKK